MVAVTKVKYNIKAKQVLKYPKCLAKKEKKINTGMTVLEATFGQRYWLIFEYWLLCKYLKKKFK